MIYFFSEVAGFFSRKINFFLCTKKAGRFRSKTSCLFVVVYGGGWMVSCVWCLGV